MPDSAHYAQVDHWPALRYAALVLQMSSRTRASGDAREPGAHAGATNAPSASAEDQLAAQFGQLGLANQQPAFLHLRGDLTTFLPRNMIARVEVHGRLAPGGGYVFANGRWAGAYWYSPAGQVLQRDPLSPNTRYVAVLHHAHAPWTLAGQLLFTSPVNTHVVKLRSESGEATLECVYS